MDLDPHAKRLAKRLSGLPLALATAGTYLQRSTLSFERYLQEYEKRWNVDPYRPTKLQEYRERTLHTAWGLSYARLETDDSNAAKLLQVLAYFGNQSFWYELFYHGLSSESPEWLHELVADEVSFRGRMDTLAEYYFLEPHLTSETWSMHNCLHDWALAVLNENVDMRYYWYALDCVDATISGVDVASFGRLDFSRAARHAMQLVHHRFLKNDAMYHAAHDRLDKIFRVSQLLQGQVQLAAAEQLYKRALVGYEKALGPDHGSTLTVVQGLGTLYSVQGRLDDAERMHIRALAGCEKALGPDDISTLSNVHCLGILYCCQGRLDEAERMYKRALGGCEKALGSDHIFTLSTIQCLGNLYYAQGKLNEAELMYDRVLAGYEIALPPDHESILSNIHSLGDLYRGQGKLNEAEQMYKRVLAGYEKVLGPYHTSTLSTVCSLGYLYRGQAKLNEAEQMYKRALAGYEEFLGPDHTPAP
jgi:tetratricopeptide (TPR) repeat protein